MLFQRIITKSGTNCSHLAENLMAFSDESLECLVCAIIVKVIMESMLMHVRMRKLL